MTNATNFEDSLFKDIHVNNNSTSGNLLKAAETKIIGATKVTVEDDELEGIKILLKKDAHDNLKEIKFICSCGQTKSIILDYSE
jgi:hypothetical protein